MGNCRRASKIGCVAGQVRCARNRNPARTSVSAQIFERLDIESAISRVDFKEFNGGTDITRRPQPWAHIGVVIELGAHNAITRLPVPRQGTSEGKHQVRRARTKDHLIGLGSEESGHGRARLRDHVVTRLGRCELTTKVRRLRRTHVIGNRIDRGINRERAGRSIESNPTIGKTWEARTNV